MTRKAILILLISFTVSCATTKYTGHAYNGKKEIYPAVIKVFKNNKTNVEKLDLFKNEFLSGYVYDVDLTTPLRYRIFVKFQAGKINTQFINVEKQDHRSKLWTENKVFLFYDVNKARNKISKDVYIVLNNQNTYTAEKNELLDSLGFHYLVMKDFTEVATELWVEKNMKGRTFNFNLNLNDFSKNNTDLLKDTKYVAKFSYMGKYKYYSQFVIRLYTNSDRFSRMKIDEPVRTQGKLIDSVGVGLLGQTYFINLVEN